MTKHDKKDEMVTSHDVKCMVCSKIVKRKHLSEHRRLHTASGIECKLCKIKIKKSSKWGHDQKMHNNDIEKHFLQTGEGDFNIKCSHCEKMFLTTDSMKIHDDFLAWETRLDASKKKPKKSRQMKKPRFSIHVIHLTLVKRLLK